MISIPIRSILLRIQLNLEKNSYIFIFTTIIIKYDSNECYNFWTNFEIIYFYFYIITYECKTHKK